jgi:hypothetical protein
MGGEGEKTYCFPGPSTYPSRACRTAMLFTNCMSPTLNSSRSATRAAVKCTASSASAMASLIGGTLALRARAPYPVK